MLCSRNAQAVHARSSTATPTVSVIIPTLNEAKNLPWLFSRMPAVDEVILVDGRSTDDTVAWPRLARTSASSRSTGVGKGAALAAGFAPHGRHHRHARCRRLDRSARRSRASSTHCCRGRLRQGIPLPDGRRHRRHDPAAPARQLRLLNAMVHVLFGDALHRPVLRLQRLLARVPRLDCDVDCDGFEIETMMNIRVPAQPPSSRCRASRSPGATGRATSSRFATAGGFSARSCASASLVRGRRTSRSPRTSPTPMRPRRSRTTSW